MKVFFSYSLTKTYDDDLTQTAIDIAKGRLTQAGSDIEIVDAMAQGLGPVSDKVEQALRTSDAIIAEATTSSPNIMFELGFARAHDYPTIILINRDALSDTRLRPYFDFLGLTEHEPLPADLGKIEYITYSNDINFEGGKKALENSIDNALKIARDLVSPGIKLLREGERGLHSKTNELNARTRGVTDPPLLRLMGGWLRQVVEELEGVGPEGFQVEPKYYFSCFRQFRNEERAAAMAVADLTDPTEPFSVLTQPGTQMAVSERILLLGSEQIFDDDFVYTLIKKAKRHRECADLPDYQLRLACADGHDIPHGHPFSNSTGQDLLLIPPDLVAGYELSDCKTSLRIDASAERFKEAKKYYESIRKDSFSFDNNWKHPAQLRAEWFARNPVGQWEPKWNYDFRSPAYFSYYDLHIRAWIPGYDNFISATASRVIQHLKAGLHGNGERFSVLEVGCGTGTLTKMIVRELASLPHLQERCRAYVAVDKAAEMIAAAKLNTYGIGLNDNLHLEPGTAFQDLQEVALREKPYDVICGSLVLSHLLRSSFEARLGTLLSTCRELLSANGAIIFSDALVPDPEQRSQVRTYWRQAMLNHGLEPKRVDTFLKYNQDMLNTVTRAELDDIARRWGFQATIYGAHDASELSPFRTLVLRRAA